MLRRLFVYAWIASTVGALPQRWTRWTARQSRRHIAAMNEAGPGCRLCLGRPSMWMLLLLPFIGLLWVPFYNFEEPALFGFPFFYWYQLAWVPISSLLIWLVYRSRTPDETP